MLLETIYKKLRKKHRSKFIQGLQVQTLKPKTRHYKTLKEQSG